MLPFLVLGAVGLAWFWSANKAAEDVQPSPDDTGNDFLSTAADWVTQNVEGFVKGVMTSLEVIAIGGNDSLGDPLMLRSDAAQSWFRLKTQADVESMPLIVDSAWRSMERQTTLYSQLQAGILKTPVARPGYSNHQGGIALDIAVQSSTNSPQYRWLADNAPAFGWTNVGATFKSPEYWHWEYNPKGDRYG